MVLEGFSIGFGVGVWTWTSPGASLAWKQTRNYQKSYASGQESRDSSCQRDRRSKVAGAAEKINDRDLILVSFRRSFFNELLWKSFVGIL
jgi:hypothetical protein